MGSASSAGSRSAPPLDDGIAYRDAPLTPEEKDALGARARVVAVETDGGTVPNLERAVAIMEAGFQSCYWRGPHTGLGARGSLRVMAEIGSNGEVTAARSKDAVGLTNVVIECVLQRVKSTTFKAPAPPPARATLVLAVKFYVAD